jgi:hypothetical protein
VTFRDLKRFIESNSNSINNNSQSEEEEEIKLQAQCFEIFKGLPFWISDINEHKQHDIANNGNCCFNHVLGLPCKAGLEEKPIFDYEMQLVNALDNNKSVFVKKG